MELNAIYENGKLHFNGAFRLKMERIPVRIVVDDGAVMRIDNKNQASKSIEKEGTGSSVLQKIHSLLGADYQYIPTDKTDKEMLLEALGEKYSR